MTGWLRAHRFALRQALRNMTAAPGSFLLNALVVAIAFALPLTGLTILENLRPVAGQLVVEPELSIFLAMDVPQDAAIALQPKIREILKQNQRSGTVEFLPRAKALAQLKLKSGLSEALSVLGENPLPDGYLIKLPPYENGVAAQGIDKIASQLKALPGVEQVQVDSAWIKRLSSLLHLLTVALTLLATALGVVVVTVVFNTIRLQVMTQIDEITISRLVGATDDFIYRPFYYTGALLGLLAAGAALGSVALILHPLNAALTEFARLYASEMRLVPLDVVASLLLLALGAALGFAGAVLSVSRQLATVTR